MLSEFPRFRGSCEALRPPEGAQLAGCWRRVPVRVFSGKEEVAAWRSGINTRKRRNTRGVGGDFSVNVAAVPRGEVAVPCAFRIGSSVQALHPETSLQSLHPETSSEMLRIGPLPGDIAEVEAYCRIFRAAEQLHNVIMKTVCNAETGECAVSYDFPSEMMPELEEKIVSMLGCMLALLDRGREEVLSGRSLLVNSFRAQDVCVLDGMLPPLAAFRNEMKRCCDGLHVALANYPAPDDRAAEIWRKLQRLKNVCYDAGFSCEGSPPSTLFANWCPVCVSYRKDDMASQDYEVAFWKGGQVTVEGLIWLEAKGYKTIVDLRKELALNVYYQNEVQHAISCRKIEMINLPVEIGTAPSVKQVELFASLVSDPRKRPLYLCSEEGINRTCAMISRWRQYITRFPAKPTSAAMVTFNGVPPKNADLSNQTKIQNLVTFKLGGRSSVNENHLSLQELDGHVTHQHDVDNYGKDNLTSQDDNLNVEVPMLVNDGVETNSGLRSFKEIVPLNAQFPSGDIFSRRVLIQFLNKKISPRSFYGFQKKKFETRFTKHQASETAKPATPTITSIFRDSAFRLNEDSGYQEEQLNDLATPSIVVASNGSIEGRNNGSISANTGNTKERDRQTLPSMREKDLKKTIDISAAPVHNDVEVVDGNMCASATGVVRVQSRKKAEMFLVRTDGYSCTREKVTESSLAFTHPSTQQQMLLWKSTPKTVLLLKKLGNELLEETKQIASFLHDQEDMNVLVEPDIHDMLARIPGFGFVQTFYSQDTSDLHERVDFVACLGGDGVILHASNIFRGSVPPVVSFNLGSLGFLTSHTFTDYRRDLSAVIHGNHTLDGVYITLRMRLHCKIFRNGKLIPGKIFEVLNEVVVDRGSNPYISKIECYEHNRLITKVQGDGVIVATPTGSTAYSTAAGGSMVHPNVPCMLFTPICPHSLSFRPVILPDSAQLELKIPEDARSNAWASFDGKRRQQLLRGDSVCISMSKHPLPTVNKSDQTGDWFHSLIRCLNWNERLEQRAL